MVEKIVSGGQSGADRAALDWAIVNGYPHGGWCPQGRIAEDGVIAQEYRLEETPDARHIVRTEWNVRDSDATVIFSISPELVGGSADTLRLANELGRPCLHLAREAGGDPSSALRGFIDKHSVRVLNVAGSRASEEAGIGHFVTDVLDRF